MSMSMDSKKAQRNVKKKKVLQAAQSLSIARSCIIQVFLKLEESLLGQLQNVGLRG